MTRAAEETRVEPATGLAQAAPFRALLAALERGGRVSAGGLWGSSQALVLAELGRHAQGPWIAVLSSEAEAEAFADDLKSFGADPVLLPARDPGDAEAIRGRLQVAQRLAGPPERRPRLLVASILSLLQPVPSGESLEQELLHLQVHQGLDAQALLERLVSAGYARQPLVELPGEVSLRGDILDVYPFAADQPVRVELFDDEVESLRTFDPETQRSVASFQRTSLCLARDAGGVEDGDGTAPLALLAPTAVWVEIEPLRVDEAAEGLRIQSSSHQRALMLLRRELERRPRLLLQTLPGETLDFDTRSVLSLAEGIPRAPDLLRGLAARGLAAVVVCATEAEAHRFGEVCEEQGGVPDLEVRVGSLAKGFQMPSAARAWVHHRELAGVLGTRGAPRKRVAHKTRALQSFFELRPGDLVVHAVHGLARYAGLERMRRGAGEEEHLKLVFADEVALFVPACRIDLVQRYVGSGSGGLTGVPSLKLDKIGGQSFRKRKEKVERALRDLAAELLEVQARRETQRRDPWPDDDDLVAEMVGSFPWDDTPDQARADADVRADLISPRPMDRLLCGDVGFGKTEIAVRAAFRVANGGGQVAVLVPTTVLAQQHYETFRERLADYPVEVAVLSRYVPPARIKEVRERTARGEIDVLVGTHRILSKDVAFQRLGLVIVDEEQRFGVAHKEHFKALRATVDVLTLTATPIPRTLHMSLSGVRDISALATPPPGRQEIETVLGYRGDDAAIRAAILHEKGRGGQVFFLHNTVHSIDALARRLAQLVPEASFAVGHGQMGARELQRVMDAFVRGKVDVLVSTTIVENGIDIPTAGTILIDQADHFGLSELHQLRGRVGRGRHKAHCHLLVDEHRPLSRVARERLKALEEMNHLGAGFGISMKDLEIRGAGNILGAEQSGHISAIGYDMYCRLLKHTIERVRAESTGEVVEPRAAGDVDEGVELELGLAAYLPDTWIPAESERLEILRSLDQVHSAEEADEAAATLRDRYGRLPPEAEALVRTFRVRAAVEPLGVRRVAWRDGSWLLEYGDRIALEEMLRSHRAELRPLASGRALLVVPPRRGGASPRQPEGDPERALAWLEEVLAPVP